MERGVEEGERRGREKLQRSASLGRVGNRIREGRGGGDFRGQLL